MLAPMRSGVGDVGHLPCGHGHSHKDALRAKRRTPWTSRGVRGVAGIGFCVVGYRGFRDAWVAYSALLDAEKVHCSEMNSAARNRRRLRTPS